MRLYLLLVAALHAVFMAAELFPWSSPLLLRKVGAKLPKGPGTQFPVDQRWTREQHKLVRTIVHNAGIYNAILAGGLLWAAAPSVLNQDLARVLFAGAATAGIFGTATLKSLPTGIQGLLGVGGLVLLSFVSH